MKRLVNVLISSIGAGLLIGLGGFVYLSFKDTNAFLAAFLFSLGLFTIIVFKLYLFTGKVGYIFENKVSYLLDLLVCFIGNLIGAVGLGYLLRFAKGSYVNSCETIVGNKLDNNIFNVLILSAMCGIMIYIAVEMQKKDIPGVFKLFAIVVPVMVFILSSFEHCVANMFYFSYANAWDLKAVGYILLMSLGNGLGSLLIWVIVKFSKQKEIKSE